MSPTVFRLTLAAVGIAAALWSAPSVLCAGGDGRQPAPLRNLTLVGNETAPPRPAPEGSTMLYRIGGNATAERATRVGLSRAKPGPELSRL